MRLVFQGIFLLLVMSLESILGRGEHGLNFIGVNKTGNIRIAQHRLKQSEALLHLSDLSIGSENGI